MRLPRPLTLACVLVLLTSRPALADATLFIGGTTTPSTRTTKGFAFGLGLTIVGVEFEYASTGEDIASGAPHVRTGTGNVYVQTPIDVASMRFYATTGAGVFRETLGLHQETSLALNTGGGVKISLVGPLKARVDYRVLRLRGNPLYSTLHRVYAGFNVSF